MKNSYDIEKIESYLLNTLNTNDRINFEKQIETDEALQKEVEAYAIVIQSIKNNGVHKIEDAIEKAQENLRDQGFFDQYKDKSSNHVVEHLNEITSDTTDTYNPKKLPNQLRWLNPFMVAASILILFVGSYFLLKKNTFTNDDLFAQYYFNKILTLEEHIIDLSEFGIADVHRNQKEQLRQSLEAYQNCESTNCEITILNQYLESYPNDKLAKYYMAITMMEQQEYNQAQDLLFSLAQDADFVSQSMARWNLALCYVQLNEYGQAKKVLEELSSNDNALLKTNAINLLKDLQH